MSQSSFWGWVTRRTQGESSALRNSRRPKSRQPLLELLESRDLPSTTTFSPDYLLHTNGGSASPNSTAGPTGTTPTQIRHAYGTDQITFGTGASAVPGDGTGETIAIVDAYD